MVDFAALAQECAPLVAPQTMAAIVQTESQFRPWAIGINGAQLLRQPATKAEAVSTASWLIAKGYNVDLGLGQVNSSNLSKTGLSVEDAFDPCKNLGAAATILQANYNTARTRVPTEQGALHAALSFYNTGSMTRGFSNGYVQKVVGNARALQGMPPASSLPIAVARGKARPKPAQAVKTKAQSTEVLKLTTEGPPAAVRQRASVYGSGDVQGVMVYR